MVFTPLRAAAPPMRVYVIRVSGPAPTVRLAVLAPDSGQALAAMIPSLGLCDIAEVSDEVLAAAVAGLEPGRPVRLT